MKSPACPHCSAQIFRESGNTLKARTSILVLHSDHAEINCPSCKGAVTLPVVYAPKEAPSAARRLVLSKKS